MPIELQEQVHQVVQQTRKRSGWPVGKTLARLSVSRASYYRWLREAAWANDERAKPVRPVQAYEALKDEKEAVRKYALKHSAIRHRELAWRMVDEDVAYLSPSTVYRILKEQHLVCPWRRRKKRNREESEKATRPDERWATDLMYVQVQGRTYYLVSFIDEYSRYLLYHALVASMDGDTISTAAQAAIETLGRQSRPAETPQDGPEIRSDHGSCYISRDFRGVLNAHGLHHELITPHCPEENGIMERANRTLREALEGEALTDYFQARDVIRRIVTWYNNQRLHRALGYLRPVDYYRGNPKQLHEERRHKLVAARHQRREANLKLRQPTLPFNPGGIVA